MELEGALPEGTRVLIIPAPTEKPKPFGERFARFKGPQRVCLRTWPLNMITIAWGPQSDDRP